MKQVHILTAGFDSPNGRAFLLPLIVHRRTLMDAGLAIHFFQKASASLVDCDVLMLDGKHYGPRWASQSDAVLEEIAGYRNKIDNLIYVDLLDSAGWDHARALPYVKLYCKSQLLRDRSAYLAPLYGYRAFTNFYHKHMGVNDEPPVMSEPVADPSLLEKLTVSWNSGLADYSWLGVYRMHMFQRVPLKALLGYSCDFTAPSAGRSNDVSCRMGTNYIRPTVSFQRRRLKELLKDRMSDSRLSRRLFLSELQSSKVALSPFGYGEICYRDFEIFMAGALLLKPDMSGVETWPDFYRDGETMVAHRWDMGDVREKIDLVLSDYFRYIEIAEHAQLTYQSHTCGSEAGELFVKHLQGILARLDGPSIARRPDERVREISVH